MGWAAGVGLDVAVLVAALLMALITAMRAWLLAAGRSRRPAERRPLDVDALPAYTILVPLYHEADVVAPLLGCLARLDYPADRLEILLLCEPDDEATADAIRALAPAPPFRLVVCPPGEPRTKARACNLGLDRATGDLCVIYDAEDRPARDQLRIAAETFAAAPDTVVCLQAGLDFHNHDHNWLTRCGALEYRVLFGLALPGHVVREVPVPLGGTSNHFRTAVLRSLGGWDDHNVTEDAELGVRLHRSGLRTWMIDSWTLEEACARPVAWLRQRTRWMKGYLRTWLQHMRGPWPSRYARVAMHLIVGGSPVNAVLLPVVLAVVLATPRTGATGCAAVVVGVNLLLLVGSGLTVPAGPRLRRAALTLPLYALLISVATYRAIWQLVRAPDLWEKTPHGLSGHDTDPALRSEPG